MQDDKNLDNPVWFSLCESHRKFSLNYNNIKFYHPDYCPFGGFGRAEGIANAIDEYSVIVNNFFVVGEKPVLSNHLKLERELVCLQMVADEPVDMETGDDVTELGNEHSGSLHDLVNLVQPGFFKTKTFLLGSYFGIFRNSHLIAVAGERLKMDHFVEVSAIVTHPGYTRQGYARRLIAHTVNNIITQGKTAYLHVIQDNFGAIKLYETLGFKTRRKMSFWNIVTK